MENSFFAGYFNINKTSIAVDFWRFCNIVSTVTRWEWETNAHFHMSPRQFGWLYEISTTSTYFCLSCIYLIKIQITESWLKWIKKFFLPKKQTSNEHLGANTCFIVASVTLQNSFFSLCSFLLFFAIILLLKGIYFCAIFNKSIQIAKSIFVK